MEHCLEDDGYDSSFREIALDEWLDISSGVRRERWPRTGLSGALDSRRHPAVRWLLLGCQGSGSLQLRLAGLRELEDFVAENRM
jgi:hypothetical protein